jgi:transcriptional regulator with XRE-family HTH domain
MESTRGPSVMGAQLGQARAMRGVSQSALARRTGVPQPAISRIESGQEVPSLERYRRLLAGLGLTADLELRSLGNHRGDPHHYRAMNRLTPGERLEQAAAWGAFAEELRGAVARGAG